MKVKYANEIYTAKQIENLMAEVEKAKALIDYNVMMGNIDDPAAEEEISNDVF